MAPVRTFSRYTREALSLLGLQIKTGRKERRWSAQELATRAGIARDTLQHIERGDPGCAIGLVFEVAVLVGVPLFSPDAATTISSLAASSGVSANANANMMRERLRLEDKLSLLPRTIRPSQQELKDDF